jgi:hypothetical protein
MELNGAHNKYSQNNHHAVRDIVINLHGWFKNMATNGMYLCQKNKLMEWQQVASFIRWLVQ